MPNYNTVILMGNVTRDPQLKQLPNQTVVAEFGLAASRKYRTAEGEDREEVCFVDCTAFGKQAEVISQYCRKGKPLFIQGRLKYDTWEDKQGGGKRSKLSVVVEHFQFVGSRDGAGSYEGAAAESEKGERGAGNQRNPSRGPKVQQADIPF
ncbi:MAG: single-stranded DNA-binding protein [Bacillota bacterium]